MWSFGKIPERPQKSRPCTGCRARNGKGGGTSRAQSAARSWPRQSTEEGQMRERARGRRKRRGAESGVENVSRKQYRGGIRVQLVSVAVVVVVSVAPSVVVSIVVSSSCPPSCPSLCPPGNFDGKSARQRHETLTSLLSRPCRGEQRSEVSCQEHSALLSKTQQWHCWPL